MSNLVEKKTTEMGFQSMQAFENLQRVANMFTQSTMVPETFRGKQNIGNAVIACEMAARMNTSPLMVMQNLYVVYGNPSWSTKFLIATFNNCGRFSSIKYKHTGKKGTDSQGCIAYATELATGETVESIEITLGMAKAEGWSTKKGSKWITMPELMLQYRAAAFLIRTTAPELSMGLYTADEIRDRGAIDVEADYIDPDDEVKARANKEPLGFDDNSEIVEAQVSEINEDETTVEHVSKMPQSETNEELSFI